MWAITGQHPGGARTLSSALPTPTTSTLTGPEPSGHHDLRQGRDNATNLASASENRDELVRKIREFTPPGEAADCDWCWISSSCHQARWSSRWRRRSPYGRASPCDEEAACGAASARRGAQPGHRHRHRSGHGGEDRAPSACTATYEQVTLAVSQKLATLIDREPACAAVLTPPWRLLRRSQQTLRDCPQARQTCWCPAHADSFHNSTLAAPPSACCRPTAPTARWVAGSRSRRNRGTAGRRWQGIGRV